MRLRRQAPAGGVQAEKQQRYERLIVQGANSSEACREVGVDRKTRDPRTVVNSAREVLHVSGRG